MQRFTVAFNFLCVLLGLLYEGRHLSLSVRRKIMLTFFIQRLLTFFYFCHVLTFFNVFLNFWWNVSFIYGTCTLGVCLIGYVDFSSILARGASSESDRPGWPLLFPIIWLSSLPRLCGLQLQSTFSGWLELAKLRVGYLPLEWRRNITGLIQLPSTYAMFEFNLSDPFTKCSTIKFQCLIIQVNNF